MVSERVSLGSMALGYMFEIYSICKTHPRACCYFAWAVCLVMMNWTRFMRSSVMLYHVNFLVRQVYCSFEQMLNYRYNLQLVACNTSSGQEPYA